MVELTGLAVVERDSLEPLRGDWDLKKAPGVEMAFGRRVVLTGLAVALKGLCVGLPVPVKPLSDGPDLLRGVDRKTLLGVELKVKGLWVLETGLGVVEISKGEAEEVKWMAGGGGGGAGEVRGMGSGLVGGLTGFWTTLGLGLLKIKDSC